MVDDISKMIKKTYKITLIISIIVNNYTTVTIIKINFSYIL